MAAYFIKQAELSKEAAVTPIYICRPDGAEALLEGLTPAQQNYAKAHDFKGSGGQAVLVPSENGDVALVLFGAGKDNGFANSALRVGSSRGAALGRVL